MVGQKNALNSSLYEERIIMIESSLANNILLDSTGEQSSFPGQVEELGPQPIEHTYAISGARSV